MFSIKFKEGNKCWISGIFKMSFLVFELFLDVGKNLFGLFFEEKVKKRNEMVKIFFKVVFRKLNM